MLLSVALILLCGMGMSWICKKLKLPGLLGMLLTGIVLGPYVLNLLDENLLNISSELRKMALIIILLKAGLSLNLEDLKQQAQNIYDKLSDMGLDMDSLKEEAGGFFSRIFQEIKDFFTNRFS